jgi:translocation and assembly module TamB
VTAQRNRIEITSAKLTAGDSVIHVSGALDDLASPRISLLYDATVSLRDVGRVVNAPRLERGTVQTNGRATWGGDDDYSVTGRLHAYDVDYVSSHLQIRALRADGPLTAGPRSGIEVSGLRVSAGIGGRGPCRARPSESGAWPCPIMTDGQIAKVTLRGGDLDLSGIALTALGATFHGDARAHDFDSFSVNGEIGGLAAKRAVALYSGGQLPWDARVDGQVGVEGRLQVSDELRVSANLAVSPASDGAPVRGRLSATYDERSGAVDFGRSTLTLPSSRADLSGVLGREVRVHLETRDLADLLPVFGEDAQSLPVKLQGGTAVFDGTVSGPLGDPQIAGRVNGTNLWYSGQTYKSFEADVNASSGNLRLLNAAVAGGTLRARFDLAVGLREWKADASSLIAGSATIRNAALEELAPLVTSAQFPVTGTLAGTARINGTIENPLVSADVEVTNGALRNEPFDRFAAHVNYSDRSLEMAHAQITAGAKQVQLDATFEHTARNYEAGLLRFQVTTNAMPLDQVQTLLAERPSAKGTVQVTARGDVNLVPSHNGQPGFRITDLHGDVVAQGLQLAGQSLGNARFQVNSQARVVHAHLDSNFADSVLHGDGQWSLEGDLPGSITIQFSRLDFSQARAWLSPSPSAAPDHVAGFAEGQLRIDGPILKPALLKAELRIPNIEIGAAPATGAPGSLTLHNSGPIVATAESSVVTVQSARLVGPSTDLSVAGKVQLQQKNPLDLRVSGRVNLDLVHELNHDFFSTGAVTADATVRGSFDAPQISGRLEFQQATFNVADLPIGLSNANGVILFSGDRATIQRFTGESGGGKITLTGFAGYGGGPSVFRLHARMDQVRLRYPEGVSNVADANLNLTGTSDRSMLAGTLTVRRTGFNPQSDVSSILAKSAQPVQTPSVRTGLLGGLNFDVQINTAPDIQFESSLTQDLQVEANLRLRGTATNPALLGRVNITRGQLVFFGTKYTINQGSIAFYNPVRVEPILNVDLETKARGIDITLTVSGPLNKLNLTPRSDPPLQFNEIVSLLASGQTPTMSPSAQFQQSTTPQSWQQMGASALLGQAIANPVAGRLERFFGVSRIRIDPTLPGVEYNPQARLTLEQQITPEITFTYITNVTTSNPQIVSVEWNVSKQWSAVATREETGLFGLDFFYKRQFK